MYGFDLTGKTAIVTGAGQGLGAVFARALAQAGASVVLTGRTLEKLENTARGIEDEFRVPVLPLVCDVRREEEVRLMVAEVGRRFGGIDILVNNAGTRRINKPIEDTTLEEWNSVLETNLTGVFLSSREVGKTMLKMGGGKIINLASISGRIINKGVHGGSYDCSKAAVVALTKALAAEWARFNIQVNAIAPGYFGTEPNLSFFAENHEFRDTVVNLTPAGRVGHPSELAGLVVYLASESSSFMNGATILVDGGYTVW